MSVFGNLGNSSARPNAPLEGGWKNEWSSNGNGWVGTSKLDPISEALIRAGKVAQPAYSTIRPTGMTTNLDLLRNTLMEARKKKIAEEQQQQPLYAGNNPTRVSYMTNQWAKAQPNPFEQ